MELSVSVVPAIDGRDVDQNVVTHFRASAGSAPRARLQNLHCAGTQILGVGGVRDRGPLLLTRAAHLNRLPGIARITDSRATQRRDSAIRVLRDRSFAWGLGCARVAFRNPALLVHTPEVQQLCGSFETSFETAKV